jgi:hypothetical protein
LHLAIPRATRKATIESLPLADGIYALNSHFDKLSGVQLATSSIGLRPKNETSTEFPNAGQIEFPNAPEIPHRTRLITQ